MAKFCKYCGKQLREGASFCPACGAQIGSKAQIAPSTPQPQYPQPVYPQYPASEKPKRSKVSKVVSLLLVVSLLAEIAVAGFWYPGFFRGGGQDGPTVLDRQTAELSLAQPAATLCGVTIEADSCNLKNGNLQAVVEDHGAGVGDDGAEYREYDISLGEQSEYSAATTLTFPCDGDPENYVITHRDHETGGWMPMIGFADQAAGTLTVYTNSFSEFRQQVKLDSPLFCIQNEGSPNATVAVSPNYLDVIQKLDKATYEQATNSFAADPMNYEAVPKSGEGNSKLKEFLINACGPLSEVIGGVAELNMTPIEVVLNDKIYSYTGEALKADLSTFMNGYAVISIGIQLTKDVKQHGLQSNTTAANLVKSIATNSGTLYSMATGYSSSALTFTYFGVAMIGMGLDEMADTARGEQEAYVTKLMNYYYNDVKPFDTDYWYEQYNRLVRDERTTAQEAIEKLRYELDRQAEEFWTVMEKQSGAEFDALMLEAGIKNIYSISPEKKAQLTAAVKNTLRQNFNDLVLPKIEKDVTCSQQATLYALLQSFADNFNHKLFFVIAERVDMQTVLQTQYNGCVLAFGSTEKDFVVKGDDWLLDTPESAGGSGWDDGWELSFEATDIAWMKAGMPDTLFVYEGRDAMGGDAMLEVQFQQPHDLPGRKTFINLSGSQTYAWRLIDLNINPNYEAGGSDRVTDWSGSVEELHVYWQELVDGELKTYDDITCSMGATADFPSDVQFSCFYDGAVDHPSDRSQTSSISISTGGSFPSQGYYPDGRNGTLFEGESAVPEAKEGGAFSVTISRGLYTLVYRYEAVPVEEKDNADPVIINNCSNEGPELYMGCFATPTQDRSGDEIVYGENRYWTFYRTDDRIYISISNKAEQCSEAGFAAAKQNGYFLYTVDSTTGDLTLFPTTRNYCMVLHFISEDVFTLTQEGKSAATFTRVN